VRLKRNFNNAFTLIELLVVVAIIAVLVALLLPAIQEARNHAKTVACLSNLRQLGVYSAMYHNEWDGYIPQGVNGKPTWQEALKLPGFMLNSGGQQIGSVPDILHCPAKDRNTYCGNYGYNVRCGGETSYTGESIYKVYRLSDIEYPNRKIIVTENIPIWPIEHTFLVWHLSGWYVDWFRHGRRSDAEGILNVLWLDGHASTESGSANTPAGTVPMDLVNEPYKYHWYFSPYGIY